MSARVSVPVLCDASGNFFGADGALLTISTDSQVFGIVQKPNARAVPPATGPLVDTLQVLDPELGTLFLLMTVEQYQAVASAAAKGGGINEVTWTAKTNTSFVVPKGCTLISIAVHVDVNTSEDVQMGVSSAFDVMARTTFKKDHWTGKVPLQTYFSATEDTTVNVTGARDFTTYKVVLVTP
jgi:hypothetical protein